MEPTRTLDHLAALLRHQGWLRRLAAELVGARDADDLVQETWLAALSGRARPERSARSWLAGILRNLSRKRRRSGNAFAEPADRAPGADELLLRAELQERLIAAVRALDEPYRSTVLLRYFDELSLEELGRRMGVPSSTARTRLARALERLRERLVRERGERSAWSALASLGSSARGWPHGMEVGIMGTKVYWIGGVLLLAGGVVAWRSLAERREPGVSVQAAPSVALSSHAERGESATSAEARTEAPATSREVPDAAVEVVAPAGESTAPAATRSPLAKNLDDVVASFLTEQPRAAELVALVGDLAAHAVVDKDSVKTEEADTELEPGHDQLLSTTRGSLTIGDMKGTFEVNRSGYRIELPEWVAEAPWFRRDVTVGFREEGASAGGCYTGVQFHPKTSEPASKHLARGEERIVGWGVEVSREKGAEIVPITMRAQDGGWRIGHSESVRPQELSWLGDTANFDAWLRLLKPFVPQ